MQVDLTQEFCLCRKPIIAGTVECADQCRTYMAAYSKTYWSVKLKKFCLYKDISNWFSRIQLDRVVNNDIYFKVSIPLDLPSKAQGEFFTALSRVLYSWHRLRRFTVTYGKTEHQMTLQEYGFHNVPMHIPLKHATDFIPSLQLSIKIHFKTEMDRLNILFTSLNFGIHLEVSNKDNPIPWIEKL